MLTRIILNHLNQSDSLISIKKLHFWYSKNNTIYKEFSLDISEQIFGLIGINGAGKTTLLKLLVGLLKPKKGELYINNISIVKNQSEVVKHIGVLFENPFFPSWIKVRDHLIFVGQLRGLNYKEAYQETNKLIEVLGLKKKSNSYYHELSAGLKQRFGIAQAFIGKPKIIFLDEPTANLDAISRVKILRFLKNYARNNNLQIIIMSHILSDLEKFCDAYGIIHNGNIVKKEKIVDLINENYYNEYLIRFTNQNDMDNTRKRITENSLQISEENQNEFIVSLNSRDDYDSFTNMAFQGSISVSPLRSLLEQVFLELVGDQNDW